MTDAPFIFRADDGGSIPELRAARDVALAAVDVYQVPGASSWYSWHRIWERAEQMLQSALWRQAVASHHWAREYDQLVTDYGEEMVWRLIADSQVAYWRLTRGRTVPIPGWSESTQLARRRDMLGAATPTPFALFTHRCWSWGYLRAHVYPLGAGAPGDRCVCGEVTAEDGFEVDW